MTEPIKLDPESIEKLEQFEGLLWHDKGDILLAAAGLKPTVFTHLFTEKYVTTETILMVEPTLIENLKDILHTLGLHFETSERVLIQDEEQHIASHVVDFFIGRTKQSVHELHQAIKDWGEERIGLILGYPETAVKAYISGDLLPMDKHPKSTEDVSEAHMNMLAHRLSKAQWKDEVKYLEAYGKALKSLSPTIYDHDTI